MAQLEKTRRTGDSPRTPRTPRTPTSPTFEQLLRVEDGHWPPSSSSPTFGINHDQEEYLMSPSQSHQKKSVIALVKERAKKLKHSLSGKKKHVDETSSCNSPPSLGVTLADDDEEKVLDLEGDPEYLGAPMYESEAAPENLKETARQHPRADPVVSEKHVLSNTMKCLAKQENDEPLSPNKTMTETVTEKLAPAYAAMSGATHNIASRLANLTVTSPRQQDMSTGSAKIHGQTTEPRDMSTGLAKIYGGSPRTQDMSTGSAKIYGGSPRARDMSTASTKIHGGTHGTRDMSTASVKIHDGPQENIMNAAHYPISPPANDNEIVGENMGNMRNFGTSSPQKWDKGVSVKEYFMNKLEPGDDEKALSEAITEAISPRRTTTGETGVVEKVKEAVTSFFWHDDPANSSLERAAKSSNDVPFSVNIPSFTPHNRFSSINAPSSNVSKYKSASSSPPIPVSTSAHEVVEEENHGRILQAN